MNPAFRHNHLVTECPECGAQLDPIGDAVGVALAPWPSPRLKYEHAVMYECPRCGARWWSHVSEKTARSLEEMLRLREQGALTGPVSVLEPSGATAWQQVGSTGVPAGEAGDNQRKEVFVR